MKADPEEREVSACEGWLVGASINDSVDHPCGVYLTERAVYVDVRPQNATPARVITIAFRMVDKAGIQASDVGAPRLVLIYDPTFDRTAPKGVAVDLPATKSGRAFGKQVLRCVT